MTKNEKFKCQKRTKMKTSNVQNMPENDKTIENKNGTIGQKFDILNY